MHLYCQLLLSSISAQRLHLTDHSDDLCCVTQQTDSKNFSQGCVKVAGGVSFSFSEALSKQCVCKDVSSVFCRAHPDDPAAPALPPFAKPTARCRPMAVSQLAAFL